MTEAAPVLVWFRQDLRVSDHVALSRAVATGRPVIPVFIHSPEEEAPWNPGGASRWWLHHALIALDNELRTRGSRLIVRRGPPDRVLEQLLSETGAETVFWSRRYEPVAILRDSAIKTALKARGVHAESFGGALLREPWDVANKSHRPFRMFTPYWRHCLELDPVDVPLPTPTAIRAPKNWPDSVAVEQLELLPRIPWDASFAGEWTPTPAGARRELERFLPGPIAIYSDDRDRPDHCGTSRLSPWLHFGQISPREVWTTVSSECQRAYGPRGFSVAAPFLRQLIWREFAWHLLYHYPHTAEEPLKPEFGRFPWRNDPAGLKRWQRGETGYPIVDAGMRQLWTTGWMHNRVRMIVGSFLVKDLLISWREGADWFWDTLVDADLANNTLGWQWIGGCGADAAPYFRIFNPVLQSEKFDPEGAYIRRWCPELAKLPTSAIHAPWEADAGTLAAAGVHLGKSWPQPIIDHHEARDRALAALKAISVIAR